MSSKYKILYFDVQIPYLLKGSPQPIGGAAVEWMAWLKAFKNIGCETGLLTWTGASKIISQSVSFDIVEGFNLKKGIPLIRFFTNQLYDLYSAIKKYNPDFIIQEGANRHTGVLAFLANVLKIPFIHRIASDMDVDGRINNNMSGLYQKIYYYGVKKADHISCQNKYQYDAIKRNYPNKNISLIYNPFEPLSINTKNQKKEYIAWIGNFRYEKNLPALARIAKKLKEFRFMIAGTKFPVTDADTEKGLLLLENMNNVEFIGHIKNNDIPKFLNKAFCLLNTSRLEGFSNTFLEAWSVGVPVITTESVNPDNLIRDYNLGLVSQKYEDLPYMIEKLILDNGYLDYRSRCINYVKHYHNPEKLASDFLNRIVE